MCSQVKAMVIINPGNPTGQCLSRTNIQELLQFCYQENLALFADEVYQQNIYQDERPFISAKKVQLKFQKERALQLYFSKTRKLLFSESELVLLLQGIV